MLTLVIFAVAGEEGNFRSSPSENLVVKAFLPTDSIFKNEKGRLIKIHALDGNTVAPSEVKITFRIQKNRQNGQAITIAADNDYPTICLENYLDLITLPCRTLCPLIMTWEITMTMTYLKVIVN